MSNARSAREIDKALRKKGFRREMDGKHIHYFFPASNGAKSGISTLMSHGMGSSAIGDSLLSLMSRQLHLDKTRFLDFIDCTVSEEDYRTILREQGEAI